MDKIDLLMVGLSYFICYTLGFFIGIYTAKSNDDDMG